MRSNPLRIATRASPMALHQAELVRARLREAHPHLVAADAIALVPIRTTGDRVLNRQLAEIGGKGLFTKEIEEALLGGRVDLAVHSLKDMETVLPDGLEVACILARDDPRDALVSRWSGGLAAVPPQARVGTSSLRRRAQLLRRRGDLEIVPIRGNVDTRLGKVAAGEVDALIVAVCGLERLGKGAAVAEILDPSVMLPAVGQGALAVEIRADDERAKHLLAPLHDLASAACVTAERAMLAALDGSCRTPIGGLAVIAGDRVTLDGLLLTPDGAGERRGRVSGDRSDAERLGRELGQRLRRDAGPEFGLP